MDTYGVIGNPIQHSLSPLIHTLFAEQTKQQLIYRPILVAVDSLASALNEFQAQGGKGLNITLPFKQQAFQLVNAHSERAMCAFAINTLKFNDEGDRLGDNTDGVGLIRDITLHHQFSIRGKKVLLLGAGGAVRGVIKPILQEEPSELVIANRTENKAQALAGEFLKYGSVRALTFSALVENQFDLIINGTAASLSESSIELPENIMTNNAYCYDMVYGKGTTPFLHWAKSQGAKLCSDGLGMLVEQAAESFFIWRGVKPDTLPVLTKLKEMTRC